MNKSKRVFVTFLFLLFLCPFLCPLGTIYALDYSELADTLTNLGYFESSKNEGTTSYRSLLIPVGGRPESLGSAYTGLCDDTGYINYNAAASCLLSNTQASAYHNSWIADSKLDTIVYTTRVDNFGFGIQAGCLYMPFSEYNLFGERVNASYYSETNIAANISYNFLAGYDFKGLALGTTIKSVFRSVPDYTDNNTDAIIPLSGLSQSGIGIMADVGLMLQFNFLKFFASRTPNVRIGISVQNIGAAFTGFGSKKGVRLDDPLPTYFAAGFSCQFLPVITATFDIKQPVNLYHPGQYQTFSLSGGFILAFTNNFSLLLGTEFKGGNPRFSVGSEVQLSNARLNFNYTLDLTSSLSPVNRMSVSAKIILGDRGRAERQKKIDEYYLNGLDYYANSEWEKAIAEWEEVLKLNKRYDPAILGIESARTQMEMYERVRESMFFEE
ncbi:MAG: UPF0164 family protein [Treponema sp.]|nr:UPF0164 family protein [Treponema sp.]